MDADDAAPDYPSVDSLPAYRERISAGARAYLSSASVEELNTARPMMTWGNREHVFTPANVLLRIVTHLYHHQGQIVAMGRLLGKPAKGLDYPIT